MKTENRIQQEMFLWHNKNYPDQRGMLFHVPNENQHRLKNIGVIAGVADLIYLHSWTAYFFEVKTPTGTQSTKQRKWQRLVESQGYDYYIVRDLENFKKIIKTINL